MIKQRPAYEEVTIAQGSFALSLRPTLRAAATLEARYGFPALIRAIDDLDYVIISEIILATATSRMDASAFLSASTKERLVLFFGAVTGPVAAIVGMLIPAPDDKATRATGKPVTWSEVYAAFYERATGWLGWTPEQAWNATPTEIDRAYNAHIEKLKAIYGSSETSTENTPDPEQAERNAAEGLDPEFDRNGLRALKAKIAGAA